MKITTSELNENKNKPQSRAITKMTRDVPYIYGCSENFRKSLATPMATFLEMVNGLLLRSIVYTVMCVPVQNLKFIAISVNY